MLPRIRSLALLILIVVLSACGGDDGSTSESAGGDAGDVAAQDETTQAEADDLIVIGEAFDLGEFPIEIAGGGTVLSTTSVDETRAVLVEYPTSEFDRLVDFYQEWSDGEPDDYARVEAAAGGIIYQNSNQDAFRSIIVSSPGDHETMMLTLTATDLP